MADLLYQISGEAYSLNHSILRHIQQLMNTRKGSLIHMADYGLPDYPFNQDLSEIKQNFTDALRDVIARYEPRVKTLVVEECKEGHDCIVQVVIQAELNKRDAMCFEAMLISGGDVVIRPRS